MRKCGRAGRWLRLTAVATVVLGLALLLGVHRHASLTTEEAREGNPVRPTEASVGRGRELYEQNCARCHGLAGRGDGPLADTLAIRPADFEVHVPFHPDRYLFRTITGGFGDGMPPFGDKITEEDRWNLINFLRTEHSSRERASASVKPARPLREP